MTDGAGHPATLHLPLLPASTQNEHGPVQFGGAGCEL